MGKSGFGNSPCSHRRAFQARPLKPRVFYPEEVLSAAQKHPKCLHNFSILAFAHCYTCLKHKKTLESPVDCKEIQPVHPKENQPCVFTGRTDAEAEAPILWPPAEKTRLAGKDPDAGRDWGQEEKGATEDEMAGWHHRLDGHDFGQIPGHSEGQKRLVCCTPWSHRAGHDLVSETTVTKYEKETSMILAPKYSRACLLISLRAS